VALTNPADILRHRQFKQDVDDLMKYGHIRHYTAEIRAKTGESTGNISNYYKGDKSISDNFLYKFKKAYGHALKRIRPESSESPPLAVPYISDYISEGEPINISNFQEVIMEKLVKIENAVARLEQKLNEHQLSSDKQLKALEKRNR
jgi:hypothetical protein